jgi:hypothetical protein
VVDVRFVFCAVDREEEDRVLVSLEIIAHVRRHPGAQLHGEHERRQDVRLVAYYRVASLADSLRGAARRDAYHGYLTPCCHYWKPEEQYTWPG